MKFVLRALALTVAALTVAQAAPSQKCGTARFTGFYSGLNVGLSSPTGADAGGDRQRFGGLGAKGGLHIGYGVGFGNFGYVGAHAYGNMGGTKIGGTGENYIKRTHDFGVNVDVGAIPNAMQSTILGLGVAVEWTRYKLKTAGTADVAGEEVTGAVSKGATKFGWRPSVFAKTFVTKNVYVGLRGSVGFNGKLKINGQDQLKSVRDTAITMEIGYKF